MGAKSGFSKKIERKDKESDESSVGCRTSVSCRICQQSSGKLLQPCACKGSVGFIHNSCLNTWLDTKGEDVCELCETKYTIEGTCFKPLREWTPPNFDRSRLLSVRNYIPPPPAPHSAFSIAIVGWRCSVLDCGFVHCNRMVLLHNLLPLSAADQKRSIRPHSRPRNSPFSLRHYHNRSVLFSSEHFAISYRYLGAVAVSVLIIICGLALIPETIETIQDIVIGLTNYIVQQRVRMVRARKENPRKNLTLVWRNLNLLSPFYVCSVKN